MRKKTGYRKKASRRSKRNKANRVKRKISMALKIALFVGSAATITAGVAFAKDFIFTSDTFSVKSVEVFGASRLSKEQVLEIAGVRNGANIFRLDLEEAVGKLVSQPWIVSAAAKRRLPDAVELQITERVAAAILHRNGFFYVDENGVVFKKVEPDEQLELPIISGPDADGEGLIAGLKVVKLATDDQTLNIKDISEIRVKSYGITIFPIGSLKMVRFKRDRDMGEQWKMLIKIIKDARRGGAETERIDLSYTGRAAVKLVIDPYASVKIAAGDKEVDPN